MRLARLLLVGLLALPGSPLQAQLEDPIRAQVREAIATWRAEGEGRPERLASRFVELGARAEYVLCDLLEEPRSDLLTCALVSALGELGSSAEARERVLAQLDADAAAVRRCAVTALAALGATESVVALLEHLDDPAREVRLATDAALFALKQSEPRLDLSTRLQRRLGELHHKDAAALLLGKLKSRKARALLCGLLLEHDDEEALLAGLAGLWIGGTEKEGTAVLELLARSRSLAVRRKACLVLGQLGSQLAIRPLIDLLYSTQPGLVKDAHWALRRLTGLHLHAEPELWEVWWERVGRDLEPSRDGSARRPG